MGNFIKLSITEWLKAVLVIFTIISAFFSGIAVAADSQTIGDVAANVTSTFGQIAQLITASSYVAGLGFAIGAILKFKAHKDNPQQITVGVPIALMFVAAALIFLPSMFRVAGETLFAGTQTAAEVTGISSF